MTNQTNSLKKDTINWINPYNLPTIAFKKDFKKMKIISQHFSKNKLFVMKAYQIISISFINDFKKMKKNFNNFNKMISPLKTQAKTLKNMYNLGQIAYQIILIVFILDSKKTNKNFNNFSQKMKKKLKNSKNTFKLL